MNAKPFFTKKYLNFPFFYQGTQILVQMGIWSSREIVWINDEKLLDRKSWNFTNSFETEIEGSKIKLTYGAVSKKGMYFCRLEADGEHIDEHIQGANWSINILILLLFALMGGLFGYFVLGPIL